MAYKDIYGEDISGRTINGLYSELIYHELGSYFPWMYDDGIKADMGRVGADGNAADFEKGAFPFYKLPLPDCDVEYNKNYTANSKNHYRKDNMY